MDDTGEGLATLTVAVEDEESIDRHGAVSPLGGEGACVIHRLEGSSGILGMARWRLWRQAVIR